MTGDTPRENALDNQRLQVAENWHGARAARCVGWFCGKRGQSIFRSRRFLAYRCLWHTGSTGIIHGKIYKPADRLVTHTGGSGIYHSLLGLINSQSIILSILRRGLLGPRLGGAAAAWAAA